MSEELLDKVEDEKTASTDWGFVAIVVSAVLMWAGTLYAINFRLWCLNGPTWVINLGLSIGAFFLYRFLRDRNKELSWSLLVFSCSCMLWIGFMEFQTSYCFC